ncbi:hypothetical protein HanOQP8_Chr09g0344501 [Helianthus annuus]|nr:hypothetical protein HanHA89_Chr09g0361661 [Helianthus annuus]KAJ0709439.1 hypothetical protein HanLR1_Chr09g0340401 [Helianthus annuus]KAJ0713312.1 hypothetical protein HanOQP8_Chr09g0344501 [Helianthus annuus]
MICYLTFVTQEPKNDQLKNRGRSRVYQEKYYQYSLWSNSSRTLGTLWSLHREEQVVVGKGS